MNKLKFKQLSRKGQVKCFAIILCAIFACTILTTTSMRAYLTATDSRVNVFTISIPIEDLIQSFILMEHKAVDSNKDGSYELTDEEVLSNDYTVYPGVDIPKDPFVRIEGLSREAYLFVEIVGENNDDFAWTVRDEWLETNLVGHHGGTVYAWKSNFNDVVLLDETSGALFEAYILAGIDGSSNGGIDVSDNYKQTTPIDVVVYSYLIEASNFENYQDAYNAFVS